MIDLEKAKKEFLNYTSSYDKDNIHISRKISHSLRVMNYSKRIAENLNLSKEQIDLATLIGLLHDIARFEQRRRYNTYSDKLSIDHGELGVEILEENNFIRRFIETEKYDKIIKIAIKNHNKYKIEELTGEELLQAQIIKDADKLDIFFQIATMYYKDKDELSRQTIRRDYMEQIKSGKCILREKDESDLDEIIVIISFIYDMYFDYSLKILKEEQFIEKILNQFTFKDEQTIKDVKDVFEIAEHFLQNK